jgi:hypothetical protein
LGGNLTVDDLFHAVQAMRGEQPIRFGVKPSLPAGLFLDPNTGLGFRV